MEIHWQIKNYAPNKAGQILEQMVVGRTMPKQYPLCLWAGDKKSQKVLKKVPEKKNQNRVCFGVNYTILLTFCTRWGYCLAASLSIVLLALLTSLFTRLQFIWM